MTTLALGQFSISLAVKDIAESKKFYETLGFSALTNCGSVADKWLIMQHPSCTLGLFEDMFSSNILTFNPSDVRAIEAHLNAHNIKIDSPVTSSKGPGHCMLKDPDGNVIMFDQH
jgi:predicted lactoylglutathione lyase